MPDDSTTDEPMTNFPVPDTEDLPEDLQERIAEETEKAGFTPNVFRAYGYKPSHFRPFFQYHNALVEDTPLDREEVEMIVVTVSGVNDCLYCVVTHGALCRFYSERPKLADQLATNHRSADLSERRQAMLDFAVKLTEEPGRVTEDDLAALREVGFTDEEIWDVGSVTSFFNLRNRMSTMADMRPNEEFYSFGRESDD